MADACHAGWDGGSRKPEMLAGGGIRKGRVAWWVREGGGGVHRQSQLPNVRGGRMDLGESCQFISVFILSF